MDSARKSVGLIAICFCLLVGCLIGGIALVAGGMASKHGVHAQLVSRVGPIPVTEKPTVDLPLALREWNWGGGSCVHASTVMVFRWCNNLDLAKWWRKTYSGGESYSGLTSKLTRNHVPYYSSYDRRPGPPNDVASIIEWNRRAGGYERSKYDRLRIPYYYTANGDVSVLDRCIAERRGATIFYYPNHSIMLVHMDKYQAIVLDNNKINSYITIPRDTFIRNWQSYGGVAIVPTVGSPPPPLPWKTIPQPLLHRFNEPQARSNYEFAYR